MVIILKIEKTLSLDGINRKQYKPGDTVDMADSIATKMVERGDAIYPWVKEKPEDAEKLQIPDEPEIIKPEKRKPGRPKKKK